MKIVYVAVLIELLLATSAEAYSDKFKSQPARRPALQSWTKATTSSGPKQQPNKNASVALDLHMDMRRSLGMQSLFGRQLECLPGTYECPDLLCCEDGTICVEGGCCPAGSAQCGTGCYIEETQTCCADTGTVCDDPNVCAGNDRCCPAGTEICGESDCYNPETEVCCAGTNSHCPEGGVCLANGRCCNAGTKPCGDDGCYDPETEVCCTETSTVCEEGFVCVQEGTGCCPSANEELCGTDHCYDPETQVCCGEGTDVWGCKKGYSCCNLNSGCYDSETEKCCEGGACPEEDTCCGEECCRDIATCGSNGYCTATKSGDPTETFISEPRETETEVGTQKPTETEPTQTEPTQTEPTQTKPTQTKPTETEPTQTKPTETETQPTETETATACSVTIDKRAGYKTFTIPYEERSTTIPNSGGKKVCVDNRELMNSMCDGIKKQRGCDAEDMKLTYKPEDASDNRKTLCPDDYCKKYNGECNKNLPSSQPCNPYANLMTNPISSYKYDRFHMSCDEFPFANSAEGGQGTAICIPGWQNSFQGGKINQLFRLGSGTQYVVQLTGWDCKTRKPTGPVTNCGQGITKRDQVGTDATDEFDFYSDFTTTGENGVMMYLGDIEPGLYTYNLVVGSGTLETAQFIDADGTILHAVDGGLAANSGAHVITFSTQASLYGVSLWGFTTDTSVAVKYNVSSSALPLTHSTTGTTTAGVATETCTDELTTTVPCSEGEVTSSSVAGLTSEPCSEEESATTTVTEDVTATVPCSTEGEGNPIPTNSPPPAGGSLSAAAPASQPPPPIVESSAGEQPPPESTSSGSTPPENTSAPGSPSTAPAGAPPVVTAAANRQLPWNAICGVVVVFGSFLLLM